MTTLSCERELSEEAIFATFPNTAEVFTDAPVGLTDQFFESFDPATGANTEGFGTDENEVYEGNSSIRIDVPTPTDPNGSYIGGIFTDRGEGRDLRSYDALTFWAKGSTSATIGQVGFGTDFDENKHAVSLENIQLSTDWKKYIVPIPDPSKLFQEKGMFIFSAGTESTNGFGYTFWMDEIRFEKLGTIAQPQPKILNGIDVNEATFIGTTINLPERGLTQTFNLSTGLNQTVNVAPSYFNFTSSNPSVVSVNEFGIITILDRGTATITATIAGVKAQGSLTLESIGGFDEAPVPTRDAANVISVFSDVYTNVPVDYYNGFFTPDGQTTLGGAPPLTLGSGQVINYTMLNFVGIGMFQNVASINATDMTHMHIDINVQEAIDSGDFIRLQLLNSVGNNETSGSVTLNNTQLESNQWVSIDVPLADFSLTSRNAIGLIFLISDSTISNIYVDNIYFYKE